MKSKRLFSRIGSNAPCLVCGPALGKMQQKGLSDLVYALRRMADQLWESNDIKEEEKELINNRLAAIVRSMCCENASQQTDKLLTEIEETITNTPSLTAGWTEIKEILEEAKREEAL